MALLPFSRMFDFEDDDYFYFPRQLAMRGRDDSRSVGRPSNRFGQPFTANNKYNLHLDLHHFEPNDIAVKVDNGMVHVNAKYEKNDEGHHVYREYAHKFSIPDNVHAEQLKCKMSPRGVLQIEAPLKADGLPDGHIPIEFVTK